MHYLYARHEANMADSTLQSQYLQELDDIIASFDEKGTLKGPACLAVKPLDLHLVNVGSIPTGPTHVEV